MRLFRIDPLKNMARFYELDIQPNLFGGYSLMRYWGRIGTDGQMKTELHDKKSDARCAFDILQQSKLRRGYQIPN